MKQFREELLIEPNPEEVVEREILGSIDDLYRDFGSVKYFDGLPQDLQDEWHLMEQETILGKNREEARDKIKAFVKKLKERSK